VTLTSKDVAEITRLLEESTFTELHLEIDGLKISLKRGAPGAPLPSTSITPPSIGSGRPETRPTAPAAASEPADPRRHDVAAPLLGTFYRAPKPGAAPFVEVGSPVNEDTIVGIIEVMKLMNAVRAGARGTVVEVLGRDGTLVEYGETLLRITRAS
jgi:acetyl-CoA carboxylase biotin carboxyl carrier protein